MSRYCHWLGNCDPSSGEEGRERVKEIETSSYQGCQLYLLSYKGLLSENGQPRTRKQYLSLPGPDLQTSQHSGNIQGQGGQWWWGAAVLYDSRPLGPRPWTINSSHKLSQWLRWPGHWWTWISPPPHLLPTSECQLWLNHRGLGS